VAHISWFHQYQPGDEAVLGGKNSSLGVMTAAGLPVPPGFAVSADAFRKAMADTGLGDRLEALVATVDPEVNATVVAAGREARRLVTEAPLPSGLVEAITEAYAELSERCGTADLPVAVRSSATCEDQPDASFAGEHDTFLWVRGADAVVDHMRRCWASLFTDRAICYRRKMRYAERGAAMSVGVQKMVRPTAAGVAFTLNPLDGDRSQIAIDASWGFGEAVVSGSVTPDNFLVDKVLGEVHRRTISPKTVEFRLTGADRVELVDVEPERQLVPCLSDPQIKAVAALARRAEKHYRCPQDVEWAIDADLPDGENVLLLQARPETVWSQHKRSASASAPGADDYLTSIVNTLMAPLQRPAVHGHGHG
jgi:pyruvate,water dikinase